MIVRRTVVSFFLVIVCAGAAWSADANLKKQAARLGAEFSRLSFQSVWAAVRDLSARFPQKYLKGPAFLKRLDGYEEKAREALGALKNLPSETGGAPLQEKDLARYGELLAEIRVFFRTALMANPLLAQQPILYAMRKQYRNDHHNTATMFETGEINTGSYTGGASALKTVTFRNGAAETRTILDAGPHGLIRDPEVSFDGRRIIFSMRRNRGDDYHIYEINADGTSLRQLTSAVSVSDIDPLYLPDGGVVFTSTREPKFCMCNRHIMGNLFRMDSDGANIHQIGKSTLHEGHSALLPDGTILYDRWEYVDRNFGDAQGLWTVNPDGTNHAIYWGNNTKSPGGVLDARIIPGTGNVLCIFGSCHDRPWGAVAIVDRRIAIDGPQAVVRTWPAGAVNLMPNGGIDTFRKVNPKYEDPYPLDDTCFLVSRMTGKGEQMGIYLLDLFGNETFLFVDRPGCFDPMPLAPRTRPPARPVKRNYAGGKGHFYVQDVYRGASMAGVKRGAVKYLRVVESPEKRFFTPQRRWGGQGVHHPGMNWHSFENKRILGTVPVEADGSASFEVPADTFLFFQLLDENGMMVQSMRSGTIIQSGEVQGCVGCHEARNADAPKITGDLKLALKRPPRQLDGWYGPPRKFNFLKEVQPVFDRRCVECHDFGKEAGKDLNLAGDQNLFFNNSYCELWTKKYIKCVGAGPAEVQPAYSWGSHPSRLVQVIREGHEDVKLTKEEFDRIVTWVDLNAPYYPVYASAYPDNLAGRAPLANAQLNRLKELTGVDFYRHNGHNSNRGTMICFNRPELSPCLSKFKDRADPRYREAVKIIEAGRRNLETHPRADMDGFVPCSTDQRRQREYEKRMECEQKNRRAIREGKKVYDSDLHELFSRR